MQTSQLASTKFRSLSVKFFRFTASLVLWVVAVVLAYDLNQGNFNPGKGILLCAVVLMVAGAIARFTIRLLVKPIHILERGMQEVGRGKLEPIEYSATGDEIEYLGKCFNSMIDDLRKSQQQIVQYQEMLEDRVRQRTVALEDAMQRAMDASRAKSEFLANMSHELRTPMNGLLGMIELSLDAPASDEQKEQLETAQRCALSLLSLLNDVLDLSKIEAGKMALELISFPLSDLLIDTLKNHSPRAAEKGIALDWKLSPSLPKRAMGDSLRLRQIVNNLVSNSIKFTTEGAVEVRVTAEKKAKSKFVLQIEVVDTGTGIPPDKLKTIFEKFTQVDGSISRRYGGTGLGLAITKKLVDLHEGEILVESELDLGTKFTVSLPYEVSELEDREQSVLDPGARVTVVPDDPADAGAVLVVEDNLVNQKVVTAVLNKRGYRVSVANNGEEALEMLEKAQFAIVLMDVQMPVLDGLEATRRMRADDRWKTIPVIAMTAHAMTGDREKCLEAGMNAYISKPVHSAHLLATIEAYILQSTVTAVSTLDPRTKFFAMAPTCLAHLRQQVKRADLTTLSAEVKDLRFAAQEINANGVANCAQRVQIAADAMNADEVLHGLLLLEGEITRLHMQSKTHDYSAPRA